MNMKAYMIKKIQSNAVLRKCIIRMTNKIQAVDNQVQILNIHFKKNLIIVQGDSNWLYCDEKSYMRHCHVCIDGNNNIVEIETGTEIYGKDRVNFFIKGKNNRIIVGKNCKLRNTCFFIEGSNNKIKFENGISSFEVEFHIEQNNNCIHIGKRTTFHGRDSYPIHIALDEGSSITIEEDCMFSNNIQIRTTDSHSIVDMNGKRLNYAENIRIGKHCWIGLGCILLKGTNLASNTVVAAGTVCTSKFYQENCIVAGNPAKIVKQNIDWNRKFV